MRNLMTWARRSALILTLTGLGLGLLAAPALAQTAEGTTITNTANVTYEDANGNSYNASAQVSVTVGFQGGLSVTPDGGTASPTAGSTDNTATFTLTNGGNGPDTVQVGVVGPAGTVITNVSYFYDGIEYATVGDLNTALGSVEIASGASITIDVQYDVAAGTGGETETITLTATSERDGNSDSGDISFTPPVDGTISVTPDDQAVQQLASNGTVYSYTFTVNNDLTSDSDFNLSASSTGAGAATLSGITIVGGATTGTITAGNSATVEVQYQVDGAVGSTAELTLTATATVDGTKTDTGDIDITIVEPGFSITKSAVVDDAGNPGVTAVTSPLPGDVFWYEITVEATGSRDVSTVSVTDALPAEVTYQSHQGDGGTPAWSISETGGTVTATLTTLASGTSRTFWIQVQVD